jgi:hypothetical protein
LLFELASKFNFCMVAEFSFGVVWENFKVPIMMMVGTFFTVL